MLQLTHVTLKTRQVILQDADFTFKKGRFYGLLAINGSGKTTLFRAISNLIPISSGNIAAPPSLFYDWFSLFDSKTKPKYKHKLFKK